MRHTIICYNAPSEVLWKTASEPAPFLFLEGNILELTAAKRLDIDAMNARVHLAAQQGHSRMPSVLRHRFVRDMTSHCRCQMRSVLGTLLLRFCFFSHLVI